MAADPKKARRTLDNAPARSGELQSGQQAVFVFFLYA